MTFRTICPIITLGYIVLSPNILKCINEDKKMAAKKQMTKIAKGFSAALVAIGVFFVGGLFGPKLLGLLKLRLGLDSVLSELEPQTVETLTTAELYELAKPAAELVTLKYYYRDADEYESHKEWFHFKVPGTKNNFVFVYSGIISAGIDMSKIEYQINEEEKSISVTLPEPYIIAHEMQEHSFKYYNIDTSHLTPLSMQDYTDLISNLKEQKAAAFLQNKENFAQTVPDNAETVIKQVLTANDKINSYSIQFVLPELPTPETDADVPGQEPSNKAKQIAVPDSAKSYRGTQYETVRQKLTDAGFTNIVVEGKKELKGNWMDLSKDVGEIAEISIAGNDSFSKGDEFPENAAVRITYYDLKE